MPTTGSSAPLSCTRPNLLTLVSVATVAAVTADMVHEALGHGLTSWLLGDRILSLSTVALQNADSNRYVSSAGTLANCVVGAISLFLLSRAGSFSSSSYFLWLFGAFNLFNSGYLIASAAMNSGDWANVITGLSPPFLWRSALALAGVAVYGLAIRSTAQALGRLVEKGNVALSDLRRLTVPAYVAAGLVMTIASCFNPISPSLILPSGIGPSFGLNVPLLLIPGIVADSTRSQMPVSTLLPFSPSWLALALLVAAGFIAVMGPGIQFRA